MFSFLFFIYGITIGSFLNVCIHRIPRNQNIAVIPSHCVSCNKKIKFYDLLPIISYIFLKGHCRHCKEKISVRYPLIETLNGILYVLTFQIYNLSPLSFILCIFFSALIVLSFIDIDYMLVPDIINIFITILALAAMFFGYKPLSEHLLGLLIVSIPMLFIAYLTKGFGLGDIFLYAAAGLLLGYKLAVLSFVIACICASIVGLYFIIIKGVSRKTEIPFVPFISFGLFASALYSEYIFAWYFSFFKF